MPSTPRPDSPFLDSALQREMGPRQPGTPSTAGKPGVQPAGVAFPNPPGVNSGAPGRPATAAPSPAPAGAPPSSGTRAPARLPVPAGAGQPSAAPTPGSPTTTPFPAPPTAAPAAPQRPAAPTNPLAPAPAAPAAPQVDAMGNPIPTGPPVVQSSRAPAPGELATQPPGTQVQTPLGTVTADPSGSQTMALSPEGQQRYKEQKAALREKLGPMPKIFQNVPGLPEMPVELGGWNFNPFTGQSGRHS